MEDFKKRARALATEFSQANEAAMAMATMRDVARVIQGIHAATRIPGLPIGKQGKERLAQEAVIAVRGETIEKAAERLQAFIAEYRKNRSFMSNLWRKSGSAVVRIGLRTAEAKSGATVDYHSLITDVMKDLPTAVDPVAEALKQRAVDAVEYAFFAEAAKAYQQIRDEVGRELLTLLSNELRPILTDAVGQNAEQGRAELSLLRTPQRSASQKHAIEALADRTLASDLQSSARSVVGIVWDRLRDIAPAMTAVAFLATPSFSRQDNSDEDHALKGMPGAFVKIVQFKRNSPNANPISMVRDPVMLKELAGQKIPSMREAAEQYLIADLAKLTEEKLQIRMDRVARAIEDADLRLVTDRGYAKLGRRRVHGIDGAFEGGHRWTLTAESDPREFAIDLCAGTDVEPHRKPIYTNGEALTVDVLEEVRLAIAQTKLIGNEDSKRKKSAKEARKVLEKLRDGLLRAHEEQHQTVSVALSSTASLRQLIRLRQSVDELSSDFVHRPSPSGPKR